MFFRPKANTTTAEIAIRPAWLHFSSHLAVRQTAFKVGEGTQKMRYITAKPNQDVVKIEGPH